MKKPFLSTSLLAASAALASTFAPVVQAETTVAPVSQALLDLHRSNLSQEGAHTRLFAIKQANKEFAQSKTPATASVEGPFNTIAVVQEPYQSKLLKSPVYVNKVLERPFMREMAQFGFTQVRLTNGTDSLVVQLAPAKDIPGQF